MTTNTVGDGARLLNSHALAYIIRGGPNDQFPNIWGYNSQIILPPVAGSPFSQRIMNIATGILVGVIPAAAWIQSLEVFVLTPFNASGNNTLLCGTVASGTFGGGLPATFNNLVAAGDVNATVVGNTVSGRDLGPVIPMNGDQDLYIQYQFTGTPPTQGNAMLLVTFTGMMG